MGIKCGLFKMSIKISRNQRQTLWTPPSIAQPGLKGAALLPTFAPAEDPEPVPHSQARLPSAACPAAKSGPSAWALWIHSPRAGTGSCRTRPEMLSLLGQASLPHPECPAEGNALRPWAWRRWRPYSVWARDVHGWVEQGIKEHRPLHVLTALGNLRKFLLAPRHPEPPGALEAGPEDGPLGGADKNLVSESPNEKPTAGLTAERPLLCSFPPTSICPGQCLQLLHP